MKYDIIIGNPPYQEETGKASGGKAIWHKFVERAFNSVKDGGYIALVHPGTWRLDKSMFNGVRKLLTSNNLTYLNMNSVDDGLKVFKAGTSFDYYLCQKAAPTKTKLVGVDGSTKTLPLKGLAYLPASEFDFYESILAKEGEEKVEFLFSHSDYESRRLSMEKTDTHVHPVVYSIKKDEANIRYSDTDANGHYGAGKVIFSNGGGNLLVDKDGTYGMSQFCFAIVAPDEELQHIADFFNAARNREALKRSKAAINLIERGLLKNLRKDFWKPRQ